jgi:hypothetical protein
MKSICPSTGLIAFVLLLAACGGNSEVADIGAPDGDEANSSSYSPTTGKDGHYVSPLAQLMRDMTAFADSTKQRLLRGEDLLPYPATFKEMLTAEPTPGMMDHRTFDPFAFAYLHQLDSLYKVVPTQRQAAFDELVQYCAACHGQVCPGPLVRIKKLRMPAVTE